MDPQSLHRGETLTLYGNGFSIAPAENTVILGNRSVNGSSYGLNDGTVEGAAEKLTVTIPNDLPDGEQGVTLSVLGNNTNSDLKITILP
ncbi:MAG: hypothetical protein HYS22_04480 [Deltaproteobacteria bacterium]|nr:hypothetical protein [Deltaproteobacteria bacterium]